MSLKIITGNIFSSNMKVIVNPINCVGVMGAGLALECRLRYPIMFEKYISLCEQKLVKTGMLWLFKSENKWVLNFPTKQDWKHPSKEIFLRDGLDKFVNTYKEKKIDSIAFPLLGADKGGIDKNISLSIMKEYLSHLNIDIEIYEYDPNVFDDIYLELRDWILSQDISELSNYSEIKVNYLEKIINAMQQNNIYQVNQLANVKGIGIATIEKLFALKNNKTKPIQVTLF